MASLRTYCKHDPVMVEKLVWMLQYLAKQPAAQKEYEIAIKDELETLLTQAKGAFDSNKDIRSIEKLANDQL
jgi:hypothetical protein